MDLNPSKIKLNKKSFNRTDKKEWTRAENLLFFIFLALLLIIFSIITLSNNIDKIDIKSSEVKLNIIIAQNNTPELNEIIELNKKINQYYSNLI